MTTDQPPDAAPYGGTCDCCKQWDDSLRTIGDLHLCLHCRVDLYYGGAPDDEPLPEEEER